MSKEKLTHSESYIKKTNRIILAVGITSFIIFIFGLYLLFAGNDNSEEFTEPTFTDNDDALNISNSAPDDSNIEFSTVTDGEVPITTTPNPVSLGQVIIGSDAKNVLTIGTNGKASVVIISVHLAEAAFDGFEYNDQCSGKILRGKETCDITMSWVPVVTGNVQNNFIISWHESTVAQSSAKSEKVPVYGNAVTKEDCNFCDATSTGDSSSAQGDSKKAKHTRAIVGPDGSVVGYADDNGYVYNEKGEVIGRLNENGLAVDADGNIIGVANNKKLVFDENGNVIGYVNTDGSVVDLNGNVIGKMLPDNTVVDLNGNVIGKAVDMGYVYDDNGNIIGQVMPDGSVVDNNGNIIGRLNAKGEVVDTSGKIIGHVNKTGQVAIDENGNIIGVVMPDGTVIDANGEVVGHVDKDGNVIASKILPDNSINKWLVM